MTSAGPWERRLDDNSPSKRRLKQGGALRGGCGAVGGIFGPLKCGDTSACDCVWGSVGQGKLGAGPRRVGEDGGPGWPISLTANCGQGGVHGNGGRRSSRRCPYLSTNHHTRTLAISSANSTKAVTRAMLNSSFVSLCAATSFWYALSSS